MWRRKLEILKKSEKTKIFNTKETDSAATSHRISQDLAYKTWKNRPDLTRQEMPDVVYKFLLEQHSLDNDDK